MLLRRKPPVSALLMGQGGTQLIDQGDGDKALFMTDGRHRRRSQEEGPQNPPAPMYWELHLSGRKARCGGGPTKRVESNSAVVIDPCPLP
jgi:hypothetical protein